MKKAHLLVIFTLLLLISMVKAEEWAGADEKAEETIKQISPDYEPWFSPLWEPPSGEIESLLFSIQSAIGAFIIGYVIGRYGAKNARNS